MIGIDHKYVASPTWAILIFGATVLHKSVTEARQNLSSVNRKMKLNFVVISYIAATKFLFMIGTGNTSSS